MDKVEEIIKDIRRGNWFVLLGIIGLLLKGLIGFIIGAIIGVLGVELIYYLKGKGKLKWLN